MVLENLQSPPLFHIGANCPRIPRTVLQMIALSFSPLRPTICPQKLQTELIHGFTTEAAACTVSNNELCTVHAAASFYQSDHWRQAIMSESQWRKSQWKTVVSLLIEAYGWTFIHSCV